MSDLVKTETELIKTAEEIAGHYIFLQYNEGIENPKYGSSEEFGKVPFLVLPSGLDVLEEMLKEEFKNRGMANDDITSVFARFKKEHGIKEE